MPTVTPRHNHFTRDIKSPGTCPACDAQHHKNSGSIERIAITRDELITGLGVIVGGSPEEVEQVADQFLKAVSHAPKVTQQLRYHSHTPGCDPGCEIAETRRWVSPTEIISHRPEITEEDSQVLRDMLARLRDRPTPRQDN